MVSTFGENLEKLRNIQRDLLNLSETTLQRVEDLHASLQSQLKEFRGLLRRKPRNDQSRKSLLSGTSCPGEVSLSNFTNCVCRGV